MEEKGWLWRQRVEEFFLGIQDGFIRVIMSNGDRKENLGNV